MQPSLGRTHRFGIPVCFLLIFGCGHKSTEGPALAPVTGRVTLDGNPLADAELIFHPVDAEGKPAGADSYGKTDAAGQFTLKTNDGREGATVGENQVQIAKIDRERKTGGINAIPVKYNKQSTLTFTVPAGGSSAANFTLTTK